MAVQARVVGPSSIRETDGEITFSIEYVGFTTLSTKYSVFVSASSQAEDGSDVINKFYSGSIAYAQSPAGNYSQAFTFSLIDDQITEGTEVLEFFVSSSDVEFSNNLSVTSFEVTLLDDETPTNGADVLYGTADAEFISGLGGNDTIYGLGGLDVLYGNEGNDVLDGGQGADQMSGGAGNDTYFVDNAGDRVIEANGAGIDTVKSSVSFGMAGQAADNLTLTGTASINGTGNSLDNVLIGNAAANVLTGGAGSDTYVVDNAGDRVVEKAGGGTDLVRSSVSFSLGGQEIEKLQLLGQLAINGTGNSAVNTLTGNQAANVLQGLGGNDVLVGDGGNDRLLGGAGADKLTGGAGSDLFEFDLTSDSGLTASTFDQVLDFTAGDRIDVATIDAVASLAGNQSFVMDLGGAFSAGEIRQTKTGGNVVIQFNTDGDIAAEMSVLVVNHGLLGSGDFNF